MPSRDYQIVFRGRLVPGQAPAEVKQNLARLFKIDVERVEPMFSGKRQVLKKGLDRETADKYRALLKKAGAIVSVVSEETMRSAHGSVPETASRESLATPASTTAPGDRPPVPQDPSPAGRSESAAPANEPGARGRAVFEARDPAPPAPARVVFTVDDPAAPPSETAAAGAADAPPARVPDPGDDGMLAPVGEQIVEPVHVESLEFDIEGVTMAQTGEVLDETPRPPALDVDTSDLEATENFEALDDAPPPPPPDIDTEGLGVAAEDAVVDDSPPPPPARIDTSELSATDDFESLDERGPPSPPPIETSHLKVEES